MPVLRLDNSYGTERPVEVRVDDTGAASFELLKVLPSPPDTRSYDVLSVIRLDAYNLELLIDFLGGELNKVREF